MGPHPVIYYTPPTGQAVQDAIAAGRLGCITTPEQGNRYFADEWAVIADNGCFSGRWTYHRWWTWLLGIPRTVRFAVVPDVFDPTGAPTHDATLELWHRHAPAVRRHGFTPAFVAQIGSTPATIPDDAPVIFLGGDDAWKDGPHAEAIARSAKSQGRHVHMGRVNTRRRLRIAQEWAVDSVDGTTLTRAPDKNLPQLLRFLDEVESQLNMFRTTT